MNRLLFLFSCFLFCFGSIYGQDGIPTVASGKVVRHSKFPSKYVDARTVDVWLPKGYSAKTKYAVLYMHDGQMLFDTSKTWNHQEWGVDETAGKLIKAGKVVPFIVVAVWNLPHLRFSDYYPAKPFLALSEENKAVVLSLGKNNFGKSFPGGIPDSDEYLKFLVEELKPFIDLNYSTHKTADHTFIAGSSMGGLISMYAVCEYPQIFGGAACLSTHWPGVMNNQHPAIGGAFLDYLASHCPDSKSHRLYFDHGTTTIDSLYKPYQQKADSILKENGFAKGNLMSRKFLGAPHTEDAWCKRFNIPLEFLLSTPVGKSKMTKKGK